MCFFQLPSLIGCRPRAGERERGEAVWPHRDGQQGAAGALRAGCQWLRTSHVAFKRHTLPWNLLHRHQIVLEGWTEKATSVQHPDFVSCLSSRGLRLWMSVGRRADGLGRVLLVGGSPDLQQYRLIIRAPDLFILLWTEWSICCRWN